MWCNVVWCGVMWCAAVCATTPCMSSCELCRIWTHSFMHVLASYDSITSNHLNRTWRCESSVHSTYSLRAVRWYVSTMLESQVRSPSLLPSFSPFLLSLTLPSSYPPSLLPSLSLTLPPSLLPSLLIHTSALWLNSTQQLLFVIFRVWFLCLTFFTLFTRCAWLPFVTQFLYIIHIFLNVQVHIRVHTQTHSRIHTHTLTHVHTHTHICSHTHIYIHTFTHTRTNTHKHTHTHTHTHSYTHTDVLEFESRRTLTELQIDDLVKLG